MDFLLIVYIILLCVILIFPFVYLYKNEIQEEIKTNVDFLLEKRNLLLENLKDLKADKDTKKLSEEEFLILSQDIVKQLEEIDTQLQNMEAKAKL